MHRLRMMVIAVILTASGCAHQSRSLQPMYLGPTDAMSNVVNAINDNCSRIPTLWTRGDFAATVVDHGSKHFVNGTVNLIYRKPGELLLVAKKDIAGRVFEVGSNEEQYWLIVHGDIDTMWWGTHAAAVDEADAKSMPIQPELLVDVLGVSTIETNLKQTPVPVMRFNNDADAYMLLWNSPLRDRWVAQREVWYDRKSKLPIKVIFYDLNGRVVLLADLSNHKPIATDENKVAENSPKVATNYLLFFPDSGTTMSFTLNEVASNRGDIPNDATFAFPGDHAGVSHTHQVDEHAAMR